METLELNPRDSELSVEVSLERIHEELGEQGILGEEDGEGFFYLSALALECHEDDESDVRDVLMEFIRNSSELEHVTREAADEIEALLK